MGARGLATIRWREKGLSWNPHHLRGQSLGHLDSKRLQPKPILFTLAAVSKMRTRSFSSVLMAFLICLGLGHAQGQSSKDLYSLVLIAADLEDASKTLSLCDLNDDGHLDQDEQKNLKWRDSVRKVDLNRDGDLSHLEIAIHFASQRDENDVQQIDRTVATRAMRKNDSNGNGQIDREEITSAWPEDPDEIDVDGDGILTLSELTNAFAFRRIVRAEIGIIGVDQGWAIKIRNRFDRDQDGKLSADEWKSTPMPSKPDDFDEDDDTRLSVMEIATMLAKHRQKLGLTAKDQLGARAMISRFDRDFDGTVSEEEWKPFEQVMADSIEKLRELDEDKDGNITLLEIERQLSKRRDEMGYTDQDAAAAKRLIQRHDKNLDQRIQKDELKESSGGGYLGREAMPQVDRNEDGSINQDELARYLARERDS